MKPKKYLSVILLLSFILSLTVPVFAVENDGTQEDDYLSDGIFSIVKVRNMLIEISLNAQ